MNFFQVGDHIQERLETMRDLCLDESEKSIADIATSHGITRMTLYTLWERFLRYGSLGLLDKAGGKSRGGVISYFVEAEIVLQKFANPQMSAKDLVKYFEEQHKLSITRGGILKIFQIWHLSKVEKLIPHFEEAYDTSKELDDKLKIATIGTSTGATDTAQVSAKLSHPLNLTATTVEGRFGLLMQEIKPIAICIPGPLLLAGSIDKLGLYESVMALDTKLPKQELFYMFLLNINRIIAGLPTISRLKYLADRSVALASGLAHSPASSTVHEYLNLVTPGIVNCLRNDLVVRAKEIDLIRGKRVAFDFHMIEFYGDIPDNKSITFGPNTQKGKMVPGFRPHIWWDLDTNTIGSIVFGYGKGRGTTSIRGFTKEQITSRLSGNVLTEVYMDSEYTGMEILEFFVGLGSHVTMCLKRNKMISKLAEDVIKQNQWEVYDKDYHISSMVIKLPTSEKEFIFVVSRRIPDGKIRCFGSTKTWLTATGVLDDYKGRWGIETGIKDLSYSYFVDHVPGLDPAKIDTHFFCVMYAKLAVDHFIGELGGIIKEDRKHSKRTLDSLRDIYLTRKNCLLQRKGEYLVLTFLDEIAPKYQQLIEALWAKRRLAFIESKIPWWGGLRLDIEFKPQLPGPNLTGKFNTINIWDIIPSIDN
jgi:hypothetical protein